MAYDTNDYDDAAAAGFGEQPLDFSALLAGDEYCGPSGFTAVNDPASSTTVSPNDLFLDHDMSAPNSNALTNLTTPSLYDDTPDLADSYDVSPAFGAIGADMEQWPPLFADQHSQFGSACLDNSEPPSLTSSTASLKHNALDMIRTPSNSASPPEKSHVLHRLSVTSGVLKSSRRSLKNLSPIEVDTSDDKAIKRARNTMAARKSRQKKRDVEDSLRIALESMTAERDHWRMVAVKHGAPLPDR